MQGKVRVNGQERELPQRATVSGLLDVVGCGKDTVVVELNGEIIPGGQYDETPLQEGDTVELVRFVGGG